MQNKSLVLNHEKSEAWDNNMPIRHTEEKEIADFKTELDLFTI